MVSSLQNRGLQDGIVATLIQAVSFSGFGFFLFSFSFLQSLNPKGVRRQTLQSPKRGSSVKQALSLLLFILVQFSGGTPTFYSK